MREKVKLLKRQTIIVDKAFALNFKIRNKKLTESLGKHNARLLSAETIFVFAGRETEYTHGCFSVDHLSKNLLSA